MPVSPVEIRFFGARVTSNERVGYDLLDPAQLARQSDLLGVSKDFWLGKPNRWISSRGRKPGRGFILLLHEDLLKIGNEKNIHRLTVRDVNSQVTIKNLSVAHTQAILAGESLTDETAVLVELADVKIHGRWSEINSSYNVKGTNGSFYDSTLNSGSEWTWTTLLADMWANLPTVFGTAPTPPGSFPTANPQFLRFQGQNAWDAINDLVEKTGHSLILDKDRDEVSFSIADLATTVPTTTAAITATIAAAAQDVTFTRLGDKFKVPEKVKVYFPSENFAFQTSTDQDENTGKDLFLNNPHFVESVATASIFANATTEPGTVKVIHDNLHATYDTAGALQNGATLTTRATELATKFLFRQDLGNPTTNREGVFSGLHDFILGADIAELAFYDLGEGLFTQIRPSISSRESGAGGQVDPSTQPFPNELAEINQGPDLQRSHEPTERLAIANLSGALAAHGSVSADIQFAAISGGSVTWADTGLPHTETVFETVGGTHESGDEVICFWHSQANEWFVLGGGADYTWKFRADTGSVQVVSSGNEVDFEGDGVAWRGTVTGEALGITTRTVGLSVEFQVNATVLQTFATAGSNTAGDTPVNVKNGTENQILLEQSTADGIKITGDDANGKLTYSISKLFDITDGITTEEITYNDLLTFGNGLDVAATDTVAIDGTVMQNVILTAGAGTVSPAPPRTILVSAGADNSLSIIAGANVTLTDNTVGGFTIASAGGDWDINADSGGPITINSDGTNEVKIVGGNGISAILTDVIGPDYELTVAINDTVAQHIVLTGNTSPAPPLTVNIDDHATANTFGMSFGNGLVGDNPAGGAIGLAVGGSVLQTVIIREKAGSSGIVLPISPQTIVVASNQLIIEASDGATLEDEGGNVLSIKSAGGGSHNVGADSGADVAVDGGDLLDLVTSGAGSGIVTTVSKAATTVTVDLAIDDTVAQKLVLTAIDSADFEGLQSGDATVNFDNQATGNAVGLEAGHHMELDGVDASGKVQLRAHALWAKKTSALGSKDAASIIMQLVSTEAGSDPSGENITVKIFAGPGNNIQADQVIPVFQMRNGDWATWAGADRPIGTVEMFHGNISIPAGWIRFTAFDATTPNDRKFPRGTAAANTTEASLGSAAVSTHDHGAVTGTSKANAGDGVAAANHADHAHGITVSPHTTDDTGGSPADAPSDCTSSVKSTVCGVANASVLQHTITDEPHSHSISSDAHVPPYQEMFFIKRTS